MSTLFRQARPGDNPHSAHRMACTMAILQSRLSGSCQDQMGGFGRRNALDATIAKRRQVKSREQRFSRAEQDWRLREMHFVHQTCLQESSNGGDSSADSHILALGGSAGVSHRRFDAISDKMESGATFHSERCSGVMRKHKNIAVKGRICTPPSVPIIVRPRSADRTEHVTPYYPRADIMKTASSKIVVNTRCTVLVAKEMAWLRAPPCCGTPGCAFSGTCASERTIPLVLYRRCQGDDQGSGRGQRYSRPLKYLSCEPIVFASLQDPISATRHTPRARRNCRRSKRNAKRSRLCIDIIDS